MAYVTVKYGFTAVIVTSTESLFGPLKAVTLMIVGVLVRDVGVPRMSPIWEM